jgi:NADPH-dependent 2,4-dienoyl-CoA reductase/sulfur reductase-like enzyme
MSREIAANAADQADIVIVGNGIAGLTAAVEARRLEPEKSIVIVTSQSHPTINTPALKQFAIGKLAREQLLAYPAGTERLQRIHLVNATVEEIHAQEGYVRLAGGQGFGYGSLLLATGNKPTGLPADMPGQDFDGVMTLHRLYDYLDLRRRLNEVEEAVVIGGGAHAIETVMGLLYLGIRVHWLIRSETFMPRMLDRQASDMVLEGTRRAGAKVYTETEALGIVGRVGAVAGVVTTRQQLLPCQLVLVCTGTAPVTGLARTCDVPVKFDRSGILVDDQLRTSARNIYAAGDVASLRDPLTGKYSARAQWYAAVLQGRAAAAAMTGAEEPEGFGVPWHATRLGDLSMLTVGNPLAWQGSVTPLREKRKGSYCLLSLVEDRLVGYLSLGATQPDSLAIKRIIDEGLSVREITKDLLRGEFDARKYFSGKRTYAAQRMITTGQLPTPLPPMPGIIAGESHTSQHSTGRTRALPPPDPKAAPRRGETAVRLPAMPAAGSRQGETASRLQAVQPPGPRQGEIVARAQVQPPAPPRVVQPRGEVMRPGGSPPPAEREEEIGAQTEPRLRQRPAPGWSPQAEVNESWVNAQPPQAPQGGVAWMNDMPARPSGALPEELSPRRTDDLPHPTTEPLVRPVQAGSRSVTGPRPPVRPTDERRRRIADQKTIIGVDPADTYAGQKTPAGTDPAGPHAGGKPEEEVVLIARSPERQFIALRSARPPVPPEEESNPHPSRSLWHYTDKHPAIKKGKKHV